MKFKHHIALILCLMLLFACLPTHASAEPVSLSPEEALSSGSFVPMSSEEYEQYVVIFNHGTEEEKAAAVDAICARQNGGIQPNSWTASYSKDMGDGTYWTQGFVKCTHTENKMSVNTVVPASIRGSGSAGYTWYDFDEGYSSAASGIYTYTGAVSCKLLSPRELYIAVYGAFEIATDVALSIGADLKVMNYSITISGTDYYRMEFSGTHVEYTSVPGGH